MKEPTKRQLEVLSFITAYLQNHAYPPTIREMADYFSISVKGAQDHITALRKKGFLRQGDKKSRTIELVKSQAEDNVFLEIPVVGTVAAGRPILAEENRDGFIRLPRSILSKNREYFALKVKGDSMIGAGIMEGDMAVIEKQNTAGNGEIAVVMLDEAATLKTYYKESSRIRLQPENPAYKPIYCTQDVQILGRLAHILRTYNISSDSP
ncbi:MAG: transcriptional repressor LexA [Treponema sp.]|jgi:repressor LexA|nr:transcriptional repressor LexA [Treponema sp.]